MQKTVSLTQPFRLIYRNRKKRHLPQMGKTGFRPRVLNIEPFYNEVVQLNVTFLKRFSLLALKINNSRNNDQWLYFHP